MDIANYPSLESWGMMGNFLLFAINAKRENFAFFDNTCTCIWLQSNLKSLSHEN